MQAPAQQGIVGPLACYYRGIDDASNLLVFIKGDLSEGEDKLQVGSFDK
jgi:hypothetical protein